MNVAETDDLVRHVEDALRLVIDPELGGNIVELGLVYYVAIQEGGTAHVVMTTTTPGCPATDYLKAGVRDSARTVPGVKFVDVALTYEPPWSPRMMTPDARLRLGITDRGGW
ncbi:hypothetical protein GCM10010869_44680 [Mesorhizobium tianshanense]|uniref:Metal-sulfur cluster biosynthetic enzyme n=1 Tax=Mesorhizobium tianshanense TaxID=39844 RepID=A0A562N7Y7_9HYPH|nr:metal-sulfur cluster assembly factor [Mesorhizobium tianshanense]TWI28285.1 metal-sulfur cluster biosynthetic enzyme [Mesorhizobium tianshanense]GLS38871.1 hypothetical protein GCM10010869_44680 [Mesorhizobium tianshanense]